MPDDLEPLGLAALNRALLTRQGLLEPLRGSVVDAVEAVGAVQAQHWPAPPVALASRVQGFAVADLHDALQKGDLVSGALIRTTLHLVSAREHAAYAVVAGEVANWRRSKAESGDALIDAVVAHARRTSRTTEEIAAFAEAWVKTHPKTLPPAEVKAQRERKWRAITRWQGFVRVPGDGTWTTKAPASLRAAPRPRRAPAVGKALDEVILRHLRAFGPAGPEDVTSWIAWKPKPVREAFERLELERFEDDNGRPLYDVPDAPRPDPETPAPPRLLAPFDSVLLAYAPKRRARILPDEHREAVYERKNLRVLPTYLIDGRVAGTWGTDVKRGEVTLSLSPLEKLPRGTKGPLVEEAERVLRVVAPDAKGHRAIVAR